MVKTFIKVFYIKNNIKKGFITLIKHNNIILICTYYRKNEIITIN